jgi:predicted transcriptional regulator
MKFEKQIERFIELRIEGKSFDEIAKELKTAKQTLIEWNKQFDVRDTIKVQKALKLNALVKQFEFDRMQRLKTNLEFSQKLHQELASRDLSQIPTPKLLDMALLQENRVKGLIGETIRIGINNSFVNIGENLDGYFHLELDD